MSQRSSKATKEVEKKEVDIAYARFDIVGEDPEKEHIADEMHPSSMDEDTCEERMKVLSTRNLDGQCSVGRKKFSKPGFPTSHLERHLYQKNKDIDRYEAVAENWLRATDYLIITYRKYHGSKIAQASPSSRRS